MISSTTQIEPKSLKGIVLLLLHMVLVRKQLKAAKGLLKLDFNRGFTTLTVWESLEDLKAFRNDGAHLQAMRNTGRIGKAKTVTWEVDGVPSWEEVDERLNGRGMTE